MSPGIGRPRRRNRGRLREKLPYATVFTHLELAEARARSDDTALDHAP